MSGPGSESHPVVLPPGHSQPAGQRQSCSQPAPAQHTRLGRAGRRRVQTALAGSEAHHAEPEPNRSHHPSSSDPQQHMEIELTEETSMILFNLSAQVTGLKQLNVPSMINVPQSLRRVLHISYPLVGGGV